MKPSGPPSPRIPSRGIPTLRGRLLDDKIIVSYIRQGYYGPEAKANLEANERWLEAYHKKSRKVLGLSHAMKILPPLPCPNSPD